MRRVNAELHRIGQNELTTLYTDAFRSANGNGLEDWRGLPRRYLRAGADDHSRVAQWSRKCKFSHAYELEQARQDVAEWRALGGFLP